MILCIETATPTCSAALCDHERVIARRDAITGTSHASQLTLLIQSLLDEAGITASELEAVAVSKGPGSYTGLRIGVSVAKGIAYAGNLPLIGVNTLTAMCHGYITAKKIAAGERLLLCPMIDARRMEVYCALFDSGGAMVRDTAAVIIDNESFAGELAEQPVIFFGTGADKCTGVLTGSNAIIDGGFTLSASYLHLPALSALKEKMFEDVAYFEPFYLKEFIATVPGKLLP